MQAAELESAAKFVGGAVASRPSSPVMAGVLIDATGDGIELRAMDDEATAMASVSAMLADAPGSVLVSHRLLSQVLAVCKADTVDIARDPGSPVLALTAGRARWELPVLDTDLYPRLPQRPEPLGAVRAAELRAALRAVLPAADPDDSRHMALHAVALEFREGGVDVVATNSRIVATKCIGWSPVLAAPAEPQQMLLPGRTYSRFVDAMSGDIEIAANDTSVWSSAGGRRVAMRKSAPAAGKWIAWRGYMPRVSAGWEPVTVARIDAADLVLAMRQAMALSPVEREIKQRHVTITLDPGNCQISAGDADLGSKAGIGFDAELTGRPVQVLASSEYMLAALGCVESGQVEIAMQQPDRLLAIGEPDADAAALVMALRNPNAKWLDA